MGGGEERWGRGEEIGGGSMHLWRTVGKGRFSLHGSALSICSQLLRAFMSKHADSVRSRGEVVVGRGGGGWR